MGFKICGNITCVLMCVLLMIPSVVGFGGIYSSDQNSNVLEKANGKEKGELLDSDIDAFNNNIYDIGINQLRENILLNKVNLENDKKYLINSDSEYQNFLEQEIPTITKPNIVEISSNPVDGFIFKNINEQNNNFDVKPLSNSGASMQSTRQTSSSTDVGIWNIAWEEKNTGWCEVTDLDSADYPDDPVNWFVGNQADTGSFFVGEKTTITVTIRNNGDSTVTNVPVNLSVTDYIHSQPMRRSPDTNIISSIAAGQTAVTTFDWTPPYASTSVRITAELDMIGDTDDSNDYLRMSGIRVCKWWDDLESSTTGWSHEGRSDLISGSADDWHLTTSAFAQNADTHTTTHSWYEGDTDVPTLIGDSYRNNNAQSLISPTIDLGNNVDERTWNQLMGTITGGPYEGYKLYLYHLTSVNWLMTGTTEEDDSAQNMSEYIENSDVLLTGEVSDDGGATWDQWFRGISGGRLGDVGSTDWYETTYIAVDSTNQRVFYYPGVPFTDVISDFSNAQFRHTFQSDNDSSEEMGYYLDDFIIYGNDNYTVQNRMSIIDVTYPKTSGVSILYEDSAATFKVKVKNFGEQQSSIPVTMWVEDSDGELVEGSTKVNYIGSLDTDSDDEVTFSWEPDSTGDYTIWLEAGSYDDDWTPTDNRESMYIHVRSSAEADDVDVLVVDDDNSGGQLGLWRVNTENKMLAALDDVEVEYRVFTVENNDTGPTLDIMNDYELVIWMTGLDNANWSSNDRWPVTLKNDDITELKQYLDLGGKLWLISPGFIWERYGTEYKTIAPGDFCRDYLKILNCQGMLTVYVDGQINTRGTPSLLEGIDDSIMDETEYSTYATEPPWGFGDLGGTIDKKDPGDDLTQRLYYQDDAHMGYNSLFYQGTDYMVVTFAFNFYLLSDRADREDCVWRVLTGFQLTGGVEIELFKLSDQMQQANPGQDISYQMKIYNPGKKTDSMELSVQTIYSQDYPTKYRSWNPRFTGSDIVMKDPTPTVTLDGLATKKNLYLTVTAPTTDDYSEYPKASDSVQFIIEAISQNTQLQNSTYAIARVPILGNITMVCDDAEETIEVNEKTEFQLELNNETNGESTVNVELSYSGDGTNLAQFVVNGKPVTDKKITTELEPNDNNNDIEVSVTAGEHTLTGYHNVTVDLKDSVGDELLDSLELVTFIEQFYSVECNTTGDENGKTVFTIDPNQYTDQTDGNITKSFSINVRNFGNGYDMVSLTWEENEDSESVSDWPEPIIYSKMDDPETTISKVNVPYYDESRKNEKYGEMPIYFDINIPIEVDVGSYIIDFVISSSGIEDSGSAELENNRVSFTFNVIKPNLVFTKLDTAGKPNFEFYDTYEDLQIEKDQEFDDYYIEKPEKGFDDLEIEISVFILNDDSAEVDLEPTEIWLGITHIDDNGNLVYDKNFTKSDSPTTVTTIEGSQKATFKFRWDPDTEPSKTAVEYRIKVIVDPNNDIYESSEIDNTAEFTITIKNIKKEEPDVEPFDYTIFLVLIIVAIIVVVLVILYMKRKPQKQVDEKFEVVDVEDEENI
jgi:hypothetical protein